MTTKGKLISFEGIDFSGKSLQARLLYEKLQAQGLPAVLLREPGSTAISEKIRAILLDRRHEEMTARAEILLYSAARTQMVSQETLPQLAAGKIVVTDRFYDSTTAYQGYGREIDLDFVEKLNTFVTYGLEPHLTFLIDLEPETALARNRKSGGELDRLEKEDLGFHKRVREGYLSIAASKAGRKRFVVIDGSRSIEAIHHEIVEVVEHRLQLSLDRPGAP